MEDSFVFGTTPFYFLRHGETVETEKGILQGQSESDLNETGRKTAEAAAVRLATVTLRSIYASPLKRTWQTAMIVAASNGIEIQPLPGLMERDWGIYEGRPTSERPAASDPETVETTADFSNRILAAMRTISGPAPVLVVSHSGVFRVLARHAGLSIGDSTRIGSSQPLFIDPTRRQGGGWRISEVNG